MSGILSKTGSRSTRSIASGGSARPPFSLVRLLGRYDAATTTVDNARHWAAADGLSANAANSPEVRRTLRNRSRYEIANNSYARGITLTLASDCVGTGPRLQMLTSDAVANRFVEQEFFAWAEAIGLAEKLRTMRLARVSDGESFGLLSNNPKIDTPVHSDFTFQHVYGDKECFHLAWRKLRTEYAVPLAGPGWNVHTIVQFDHRGQIVF